MNDDTALDIALEYLAAERALADRLAEALRLAMPYVRPHAPLGSAPQIEGETALAEHDRMREAEG